MSFVPHIERQIMSVMKKHRTTAFLLFFLLLLTAGQSGRTVFARTGADGSMDAVTVNRIDQIVEEGIKAKAFPGCQVLVVKDGTPIYEKCFGHYTYESSQPVKPTTIYDLASLSKTTGTLLAIMKLYDMGKLKLTDKASAYLPFLRGTDKEGLTITELLFHESGLPGSLPFERLVIEKRNALLRTRRGKKKIVRPPFQFKEGWVSKVPSLECPSQVSDSLFVTARFHDAAMQMIADTRLNSKSYCYSCINFILLKEISEKISGMPMDVFLDREFFIPLKLHSIGYLPLRTHKKNDIAPTLEKDLLRHGSIQGFVNDPPAALLGGVSGNAGLFATARDVAKVHQMLLNGGEIDGTRYLSTATCTLFTTTTSASGRRGLGFDKQVSMHTKADPSFIPAPMEMYGHTGYTGTCCWVDPVNRFVYVFLSNRTYPNNAANALTKLGIRSRILEEIYQSLKIGRARSTQPTMKY